MMNNQLPYRYMLHSLTVLLAFLSCVITFNSHAMTLEELIANNELSVETSIKQNEQQIVGQPIIVSFEVSTNRWFAKGTKVNDFELANTIKLANSENSINGTKRINGETWSTQTREVTIYPQKAGKFTLPEVNIEISVNTEHDGIVEGSIKTQQQNFTVTLPKALANIEHFIVSPMVELNVSSNAITNKDYAIGDAVSMEIEVISQQSPAMMIPPLEHPIINGISIYQKTPKIFDTSNRGQLVGKRIESITYIFEQEGKFTIPPQSLFWWNTQKNILEEITISGSTFTVGKSTSKTVTKDKVKFVIEIKVIIKLIIISAILLLMAFGLQRYKKSILTIYSKITHLEQRRVKKAFFKAIEVNNYLAAVNLLHDYCALVDVSAEQLKSKSFLKLNQLAFDKDVSSLHFDKADAEALIKTLQPVKKEPNRLFNIKNKLKLNNE